MSAGTQFYIKDFCEAYFKAERSASPLAGGYGAVFTEEDKAILITKLTELFRLRAVSSISNVSSILVAYGGGSHGRHYARLNKIYPTLARAEHSVEVLAPRDPMLGFKENLVHNFKGTCTAGIKNGLTEDQISSLFKDALNESKIAHLRIQRAAKIDAFLRETGLSREEMVEVLESF